MQRCCRDLRGRQMSPSTPVAPSQATEILRATSKKLAETPSLHFSINIDGDAYIDDQDTIRLIEAEGDVVRPDRVIASFKVNVLNSVNASISMITIADQHWSTDLISGKWISAPAEFAYDPGILFDNTLGIGPVMDQVTDATLVGEESIDGKNVFHITAGCYPGPSSATSPQTRWMATLFRSISWIDSRRPTSCGCSWRNQRTMAKTTLLHGHSIFPSMASQLKSILRANGAPTESLH